MRFPILCKKQTRLPNEARIGSSSPLYFSRLMSRLGLKKDAAGVNGAEWVPEIGWSSTQIQSKIFRICKFYVLDILSCLTMH